MRFIYTISLASLLFFYGCDQEVDITSPISESADQQLKGALVHSESYDTNPSNLYLHREEYPPGADKVFTTMGLPESEIPNLRVSKVIDGNVGGQIDFDYEYQTQTGDVLIIDAQLKIPIYAFDGVEEISMIFNHEILAISFYPHMVFNETVLFRVKYEGIDLSGIDPNSVDFIFQNYEGTLDQIEFGSLSIQLSQGKIDLQDSELHHFSRYGFVN